MTNESYEFRVHDERLAIARLAQNAPIPTWARGGYVVVARTPDELSVVCAQAHVPSDVVHDRDKIAFGVAGTVPMTITGMLAALCNALAAADVPVFVISTHDTDWLLVSAPYFEAARGALIAAGHRVTGELP